MKNLTTIQEHVHNKTLLTMPEHFISAQNGKLITTSLAIAEAFEKQHKHVIQKISSLECDDEFLTANFSAIKNVHRGNEYTAYRMTKDGFMLLVMGFTGKKAMAIKIAYINAFNKMAEELARQQKRVEADKQKQLQQIAAKGSKENELFVASPAYRQDARRYVDDVLHDCRDFALEHGISMEDWTPVDRDKAASGLLADLLYGVRAELTFNSALEPQFKILPPGAMYIMPTDPECMKAVAERGVSTNILAVMLQVGIARLAASARK